MGYECLLLIQRTRARFQAPTWYPKLPGTPVPSIQHSLLASERRYLQFMWYTKVRQQNNIYINNKPLKNEINFKSINNKPLMAGYKIHNWQVLLLYDQHQSRFLPHSLVADVRLMHWAMTALMEGCQPHYNLRTTIHHVRCLSWIKMSPQGTNYNYVTS